MSTKRISTLLMGMTLLMTMPGCLGRYQNSIDKEMLRQESMRYNMALNHAQYQIETLEQENAALRQQLSPPIQSGHRSVSTLPAEDRGLSHSVRPPSYSSDMSGGTVDLNMAPTQSATGIPSIFLDPQSQPQKGGDFNQKPNGNQRPNVPQLPLPRGTLINRSQGRQPQEYQQAMTQPYQAQQYIVPASTTMQQRSEAQSTVEHRPDIWSPYR